MRAESDLLYVPVEKESLAKNNKADLLGIERSS